VVVVEVQHDDTHNNLGLQAHERRADAEVRSPAEGDATFAETI
jgi:hypothetical protein